MLTFAPGNLQSIKQRGMTEEYAGIYGVERRLFFADPGNDISIQFYFGGVRQIKHTLGVTING